MIVFVLSFWLNNLIIILIIMKGISFWLFAFFTLFSIELSAQSIEVSGTVWGYPFGGGEAERLAGVSILEHGTLNGTSTDFDGHFLIRVSSPKSKLVFDYIGYFTEVLVVDQIIGFPENMIIFLEEETGGYERVDRVNKENRTAECIMRE